MHSDEVFLLTTKSNINETLLLKRIKNALIMLMLKQNLLLKYASILFYRILSFIL